MNKSRIATLLIAVAVAAGVLYVLGIFDNSPSSVTIETSLSENTTGPTSSDASISFTQKEEVATQTTGLASSTQHSALTEIEVAKHTTKRDCWMIINDNVYDVTSYIPHHRGGERVIIQTCGTNATTAFTDVRKHSKPSIEAELAKYLLGALVK